MKYIDTVKQLKNKYNGDFKLICGDAYKNKYIDTYIIGKNFKLKFILEHTIDKIIKYIVIWYQDKYLGVIKTPNKKDELEQLLKAIDDDIKNYQGV